MMKIDLKSVQRFKPALACAPAWIALGSSLALTSIIGWGSIIGLLIAFIVSLSLFVTVFSMLRAQKQVGEITEDLEACRTRELRLRTTVDGLPALVWTSGDGAARNYVGESWVRFTGQGLPHPNEQAWLEQVHPDDRQACRGAHRIAVSNREPFEIQYRVRQADGEYAWVLDRAVPCKDQDGSFCGYVGATMDISAHKAAEMALRARADELQRVNDNLSVLNEKAMTAVGRIEEVERLKQQAEDSGRVKSQYLAAVADELRKPLAEICNAADLLKTSELSEQQKPQVARVRAAADSLNVLLGRTIELSEVAGEAQDTDGWEFDLRQLLDKEVERMTLSAEERGLTLDSAIDQTLPVMVRSDAARLRHVLGDLWSAAAQLCRKGLMKVKVAREAANAASSLIHVAISFKGAGVPQERLDRAYYPAESVRRELIGLGLGPAKRMIEHIGGQMGIRRDENGWIIFWLSLNVQEVDPHCDGRRVQVRLAQESLQSSLGTVLDLSMGGMRVRCNRPPIGVIDLELSDDEETLNLRAEVVWAKRTGFRRQEAGLRFVDLSPEASMRLSRMAMRNRMRRVMEAA